MFKQIKVTDLPVRKYNLSETARRDVEDFFTPSGIPAAEIRIPEGVKVRSAYTAYWREIRKAGLEHQVRITMEGGRLFLYDPRRTGR